MDTHFPYIRPCMMTSFAGFCTVHPNTMGPDAPLDGLYLEYFQTKKSPMINRCLFAAPPSLLFTLFPGTPPQLLSPEGRGGLLQLLRWLLPLLRWQFLWLQGWLLSRRRGTLLRGCWRCHGVRHGSSVRPSKPW